MPRFDRKKPRTAWGKFRAWLDYNPPHALSAKGWRLFKEEFRRKAPVRYWLQQKSTSLRHALSFPLQRLVDWFRYRTSRRYHIVKTGLTPNYYEVAARMLHANFNLLKDYVEVEQAWHYLVWNEKQHGLLFWCRRKLPLGRVFFPFRQPDLGLKYLDWAATLDDKKIPKHQRSNAQAKEAREIKALYIWWTKTRPERKGWPVPEYDNQGMGLFSSMDEDFDRNAADYKIAKAVMKKNEQLEAAWEKEDTAMLIRLIKIRSALWT